MKGNGEKYASYAFMQQSEEQKSLGAFVGKFGKASQRIKFGVTC